MLCYFSGRPKRLSDGKNLYNYFVIIMGLKNVGSKEFKVILMHLPFINKEHSLKSPICYLVWDIHCTLVSILPRVTSQIQTSKLSSGPHTASLVLSGDQARQTTPYGCSSSILLCLSCINSVSSSQMITVASLLPVARYLVTILALLKDGKVNQRHQPQ